MRKIKTILLKIIRFFFPDFRRDEKETIKEKPVIAAKEKPEPKPHKQKYCWCLDNGHGKLQAGKRSGLFEYKGKQIFFYEWEFNRDIVNRVIKQLKEVGINYYNVVPDSHKKSSFLKGRVDRANEYKSSLPKIYLSIHSNAYAKWGKVWSNASGIEVWHEKGNFESRTIAEIFQENLVAVLGWKDRGIRQRSKKQKDFYVLRKTESISVLTESGFFTNKQQVKELMKDEVRQKIADAHVAAIMEIEGYNKNEIV